MSFQWACHCGELDMWYLCDEGRRMIMHLTEGGRCGCGIASEGIQWYIFFHATRTFISVEQANWYLDHPEEFYMEQFL